LRALCLRRNIDIVKKWVNSILLAAENRCVQLCTTSLSAVRVDLCDYWRRQLNVVPIAGIVSAFRMLF